MLFGSVFSPNAQSLFVYFVSLSIFKSVVNATGMSKICMFLHKSRRDGLVFRFLKYKTYRDQWLYY